MKSSLKSKKVFISYSTKDKPYMDDIRSFVTSMYSAESIFSDKYSLSTGEKWEEELYNHIITCDIFIIIWSKNSSKSEWVDKEINLAISLNYHSNKPKIVPIIIDGTLLNKKLEGYQSTQLNINKKNNLLYKSIFYIIFIILNFLILFLAKNFLLYFLLNMWLFILSYSYFRRVNAPWNIKKKALFLNVIDVNENIMKLIFFLSLLNFVCSGYVLWF